MYRRRRPRRTVFIVMMLILLGLTVGVWAWTRGDSAQQSGAEYALAETSIDHSSQTNARSTDRPRESTHASGSSNDETPRITMGQRIPLQSPDRSEPAESQRERPRPAVASAAPQTADPERVTQPEPTQSAPARPTRESRSESAGSSSPPANQRVTDRMRSGMELLKANQPIEARRVLTQALLTPGIDRRTAREIRATLTELNERLVFGRDIVPGDPFSFGYTIRPGDTLARIASRENTHVDWRFIQRINGIARPEAIQAGRQLKLVQGPFHAVVVKQEYRMDVFLGEGSDRVYVRSFEVGLGEHDSTPVGRFRVRSNSKLVNPAWTNPRTGQHYAANDPENPIGTRWIGLEGVTEAIRNLTGYGIHGTIEPDSIGRQESMGCIRLRNSDVELLYEMLVEQETTVEVVER